MKVGFVALHYPHIGHRAEFVARVQHAAAVIRPTPGCLSADCWLTAAGDAVVSIAQWHSNDTMDSSMATARAAEWTSTTTSGKHVPARSFD
jgi:quinol monooxygenase YgiN